MSKHFNFLEHKKLKVIAFLCFTILWRQYQGNTADIIL